MVCPLKENFIILNAYDKKHHKVDESDIAFRGSEYRGVSKNGKSWQVFIIADKQILHVGKLRDPLLGAFIYDIATIQTKGLKSRINFNYTKSELLAILNIGSFMNIKQAKLSPNLPTKSI